MDKLDCLISEMKRKKLSSRHDKITELNKVHYTFGKKESVFIDFNQIIEYADNNQLPTIETIRKMLIDAINILYEEHNFNNGVLNHCCCFDENRIALIKIINKVLDKHFLMNKIYSAMC